MRKISVNGLFTAEGRLVDDRIKVKQVIKIVNRRLKDMLRSSYSAHSSMTNNLDDAVECLIEGNKNMMNKHIQYAMEDRRRELTYREIAQEFANQLQLDLNSYKAKLKKKA